MIYGYIRVSTDRQNINNQKFEILNFCKKENLHIDKWINETVCGIVDLNKRKLGYLLNILTSGDILITSELSRLGRNLMQVMSILNMCLNKNIQVWTIKDNYRLGKDIQSKVLAFAFGLSAEIERNLISQRTKEALKRVRNEGKKLGRPLGTKNHRLKLSGNEKAISQMLKCKTSLISIAKTYNVSRTTLYKFIKEKL